MTSVADIVSSLITTNYLSYKTYVKVSAIYIGIGTSTNYASANISASNLSIPYYENCYVECLRTPTCFAFYYVFTSGGVSTVGWCRIMTELALLTNLKPEST